MRQQVKSLTRIASIIFGAALFCLIMIIPACLSQKHASQESTRAAANYAEDAYNDVRRKCVTPQVVDFDDCSDKIEISRRQNEIAEYNLEAQKTVAIWTAVMGGVTVLGVALSAVGVVLVYDTFKETRANVTALINAERARLRADLVRGIGGKQYHLQLKNIGRTEASDIVLNFFQSADKSFLQDFEKRNIPGMVEPDLPSGINIDRIFGSKFVGVYVDYKSRFGIEHRDHFLFDVDTSFFIPNVSEVHQFPLIRGDEWPADT